MRSEPTAPLLAAWVVLVALALWAQFQMPLRPWWLWIPVRFLVVPACWLVFRATARWYLRTGRLPKWWP